MITSKTSTWREMLLKWQKDPTTLFNTILRYALEVGIDLDTCYIVSMNRKEGRFEFKSYPPNPEQTLKEAE